MSASVKLTKLSANFRNVGHEHANAKGESPKNTGWIPKQDCAVANAARFKQRGEHLQHSNITGIRQGPGRYLRFTYDSKSFL